MLICATDDGGDKQRETVLIKKVLRNVILDSLLALCSSKIDVDRTLHFNTSELSNKLPSFSRETFL